MLTILCGIIVYFCTKTDIMRIKIIKVSIVILYLFSFLQINAQKPKNVIILIGDGMGPVQIETLKWLRADSTTNILQFPYIGYSQTYSLNDSITDSAAGGSALSTGKKTKNGYIAMNDDGSYNQTIFEWAKQYQMATGIVVSCGLTHATPACFYAHVSDRNQYESIAYQLVNSDIDFAAGGQRNHFLAEKRNDKMNIIDSLEKRNYTIINNLNNLSTCNANKIIALVSKKHPLSASKRNNMLSVCTTKALSVLSNDSNGFVLMIEGSQIDWACHINNFSYFKEEIIDFDNVVKIVYDFAKANGETLVIVTADHECGDMKLSDEIKQIDKKEAYQHVNEYASFHSINHTNINVPVFAYGPGAENFQGIMENTSIFDKIIFLLTKP